MISLMIYNPSPNIIRVRVWAWGRGEVYTGLAGKPEGKKPLGRRRRRWEGNIKMDLQEVGCGMDWIDLAEVKDRWRALVEVVMKLRFPKMREIS